MKNCCVRKLNTYPVFFLIQHSFILSFYFSRRVIFTENIDPHTLLKVHAMYIEMGNELIVIFFRFRTKPMFVLSYQQNTFASKNTHNYTALTLTSKVVK